MKDQLQINMNGVMKIQDAETNEIVFQKSNAIHPQNMSLAIAKSLARDANGSVFKLCFGNGGTFINSSEQIVYRPPNTIGVADLYNQTYEVQVDDQTIGTPPTNSVMSAASPSPAITAVVTITAQLNANEPAGQALADNLTVDPESPYVFDEVGLKTADNQLLSHLVFSPFEKTANRAFLITYVLTISVS